MYKNNILNLNLNLFFIFLLLFLSILFLLYFSSNFLVPKKTKGKTPFLFPYSFPTAFQTKPMETSLYTYQIIGFLSLHEGELVYTYQNLVQYSSGQSLETSSRGDPRTVKPSYHICLAKNGAIRGWPKPEKPSGGRVALSFCSAGNAKRFLLASSMASRMLMGMPWLMTWNTPQLLHASPTSVNALGSLRSITGTDSAIKESTQGCSPRDAHACESGNSWIEFRSNCFL